MKNKAKNLLCFLFVLVLALCVTAALGSREAYAATKYIAGTVDASALGPEDEISLTDDSQINIAEGDDVTIKSISLKGHSLLINGSNAGILRVSGGPYCSISMESGTLTITGGHVIVGGDETRLNFPSAIGPLGTLQMMDGILEVEYFNDVCGLVYGIDITNFSMTGGIVNVNVGSAKATAKAMNVDYIDFFDGTLVARANASGENAYAEGLSTASSVKGGWTFHGGNITLEGIATGGGEGTGMWCSFKSGDVNTRDPEVYIEGGRIYAYGSYIGIHTLAEDDLDVRGDAVVRATGVTGPGMFIDGKFSILDDAVVRAETVDTSTSDFARYGCCIIVDGIIIPYSDIVYPVAGYYDSSGTHMHSIVDADWNLASMAVFAPRNNSTAADADDVFVSKNSYIDYFSSDKLLYNPDKGMYFGTADDPDWTARYEPQTGTLYLRGYEDTGIGLMRTLTGKKLVIDVSGTNKINCTGTFGIEASGNDIELVSYDHGRLEITGSAYDGGDGAAITSFWSGSDPTGKELVISGNADVYINTYHDGESYGLWSSGDLVIRDHAKVDVNVRFGDRAGDSFSAIRADKDLIITTDKWVNASAAARDGWEYCNNYASALLMYNYTGPNGSSRLSIVNAEYVSFSVVGDPGCDLVYSESLPEDLFNGAAGTYGVRRYCSNDSDRLFIVRSDYADMIEEYLPVTGALFPDPSFRAYVADNFDTDGNGFLSPEEISVATTVEASGSWTESEPYSDAYSIAGIEFLRDLEKLTWRDGFIRTLMIDGNAGMLPQLTFISVSDNFITDVDLAGLSGLETLRVSGNGDLIDVDLSTLTGLKEFDCSNCSSIYELDLSNQKKLVELSCCEDECITGLDLSACTNLERLYCWGCDLSELDLSNNSKLKYIDCYLNHISGLDVSMLGNLRMLTCQENGMTSLTLGIHNDLNWLMCYGNNITHLNFAGTPKILKVYQTVFPSDTGDYMLYENEEASLGMDNSPNAPHIVCNMQAIITACRLELTGKIGIRLYFRAPEEAKTAKIFYEADDFETPAVTLDLSRTGNPYYNASQDVFLMIFPKITSREMTMHIRFMVYDEDGNAMGLYYPATCTTYYNAFDYCAADWANRILDKADSTEEAKFMAKALLNYGGCAQKYLNDYNPGNPANPLNYLAEEMEALMAHPANDAEIPANSEELGYQRTTLQLSSDTDVRIYFNKPVTVKVDGANAKVSSNGSVWLVVISGISSRKLDHKFEVEITGETASGTLYYSALSWANDKLDNGPEEAVPTAKALYLYNQAAKAYLK